MNSGGQAAKGPFGTAVEELLEAPGVRRCAILDRSGRILAQRGFDSPGEARKVGTLAAGIHATGTQLSKLLGEERPARVHTGGRENQFVLLPVPGPGDLLLFLVLDADVDPVPIRQRFETTARILGRRVAQEAGGEVDPESFEESLNQSLHRLFPTVKEGPV